MDEVLAQEDPSLLQQYLESGISGYSGAERGRNTAFGASRGLADRESVRKTAQLLVDTFKNQLMQPDQGRQYEDAINMLLKSNKTAEAFQVAGQGVEFLKDKYKIFIG